MEKESIWEKGVAFRSREKLTKQIMVDTAVIGGGMAGILTACLLQEKGISCVVLEANRIGSGQTRHTTAKVTSQHNLIYDRLLRSRGKEIAKQYAQANEAAIENYRRLIVSRNIDCDWRESTAYLYTMQNTAALERECAAAKSLGICAEMIAVPENAGKPEIPIPAEAVLSFAGQAQFHPLKFLASIANEVKVYEHSRVLQVDEEEVILADGRVRAEHIVLAAHYPFVNVPGYYFLKMHQERSYVLALQETGKCRKEESSLGKLKGMYIGIDKGGLSLRRWNEYLLLGGEGHRTGENAEGGQYQRLARAAARYFPEKRIAAKWSAQDCMTLDQVPYIGNYSRTRKNWYVATGFGKWGMTGAMTAAMILSDLIAGKKSPWTEVFSPLRSIAGQSGKAALHETGHAVRGLIGGKTVQEIHRCTHLGCHLTWNPEEGTYDCPCHGSRFDAEGHLADGPAQKDL